MADTLKDFLVGIGFKVDTSAAAKVTAAVDETEAKLTKSTRAALDARRKAEDRALAARIEAVIDAGETLSREEQNAADRITKRQADEEAKRTKQQLSEEEKREKARAEAEKKQQEARAKGLKDAQSFVLKMSAFAVKAVAAVEASALGVVYAVDKAAKSFDKLNFMSQRTGAAPGKIGAFGYASSQLGSSSEEANSSLESFGQKLRMNGSGYGQALDRLGVKARDANGHLRDSADLATELGDALRRVQERGGKYGYANAVRQGEVFGFSENQTRALMSPDFRKRQAEYRADQKKIGADPDAAAKSGTAFEQSMRHLEAVLDQVGTKINGVLFEKLKPLLDQLAAWFAANGDRVANIISRIADDLVKLAKAIGEKLASADWDTILSNVEKLAKRFDELAKTLGGKDGLNAAFIAFGSILALRVLAPLTGIVGALARLSAFVMPPWLAAMLGIGAAAVATEHVAKGAFDKGFNAVSPGANTPEMLENQGMSTWQRAKRVWGRITGQGVPLEGNEAIRHRGSAAKKARAGAGPDGIPYAPTSMTDGTGFSKAQYDAYREGVTDIEGKRYDRMGGAGGRYAGRYQMGPAEITETAKRLGVPRPSNEQFLSDPAMQEKFFENYTLDHYESLMKNPKFAAMSPEDKLKMLGYAHNQGVGSSRRGNGAMGYIDTGRAGVDGFGTSGTAYFGPIGRRLKAIPPLTRLPPMKRGGGPGIPQGMKGGGYSTLGLGPDGRPVGVGRPLGVGSIDNSQSRGDTSIVHNPTFNIQGGNAVQNMEAARRMAGRGQQDLLRNLQGAEQ